METPKASDVAFDQPRSTAKPERVNEFETVGVIV
jgi:hypothetical protein